MDDSKSSFLIPAGKKKCKPRVLQIMKIKNYGNVERGITFLNTLNTYIMHKRNAYIFLVYFSLGREIVP